MSSHREVENYLNEIEGRLGYEIPEEQKRFYAIKLFERDDKIKDAMKNAPDVEDIIARAEKEMDDDAESNHLQMRDTVSLVLLSETA